MRKQGGRKKERKKEKGRRKERKKTDPQEIAAITLSLQRQGLVSANFPEGITQYRPFSLQRLGFLLKSTNTFRFHALDHD